jgi:protein-tyrosine phosphatase
MPFILFVCTANRFRSPIAAAYVESQLRATSRSGTWLVSSAGTWTDPGLPAHPKALSAAAGLGLDLSTHHTREVNTTLLSAADLIIVMERSHKEALECEFPFCRGRIALLGELAGEGNPEISDPSKMDFEESDATARTIAVCIEKGFPELLHRAEVMHRIKQSQRSSTTTDSPTQT